MSFYINTKGILKQVKEKKFKIEREIQYLFESNLQTIMGLELVKSEFKLHSHSTLTESYSTATESYSTVTESYSTVFYRNKSGECVALKDKTSTAIYNVTQNIFPYSKFKITDSKIAAVLELSNYLK